MKYTYTHTTFWGRNDTIAASLLSNVRFQGKLVAFSRPDAVGGLGHIGWGFRLADGRYCYGATENPTNEEQHDPFKWVIYSFWQGTTAQGGDNQAWIGVGDATKMLKEMQLLGGTKYKVGIVTKPNPRAAHAKAVEALHNGYTGLTNNCLDAVYHILAAYGADHLPWPLTNPTPNGWFDALAGRWLWTSNLTAVR